MHAQQVEQRHLVAQLAGEIVRVVVEGQVAIDRRIPVVVIDAVQDAADRVAAGAQVRVEAVTALGCTYLLGIRRADRRHRIRVENAVPHRVDATVTEIGLVQGLDAHARPHVGGGTGREDALVTDVVDREYAAGRAEDLRVPCIGRAQQQRRERRVPVIAMHDIRREAEPLAAFERRACEHQVAHVLVVRVRINEGTVEHGWAVHELHPEVRTRKPRFPDVVAVLVGADPYGQALQRRDRALFATLQVRERVQRHEDADVMTTQQQVARKRGRNVTEPAGLGKRRDLRGQEADALAGHASPSLPQRPVASARSGWMARSAPVSLRHESNCPD